MNKQFDVAILSYLPKSGETPFGSSGPVWLEGLDGLEDRTNSKLSIVDDLPPRTGEINHSYFKIIVSRTRNVGPTVHLAPFLTVTDTEKYIGVTLAELEAYVAAKNRHSRHWVEQLIDEKLDHLRQCGVEAEIKEVH
jgi:hypothetical protein